MPRSSRAPRALLGPLLAACAAPEHEALPAEPENARAAPRTAVGWPAAGAAVEGWLVSGQETDGSAEGRFELAFTRIGLALLTSGDGSSLIFDARDVWAVDATGMPRRFALGSRARALADLWLPVGAWLWDTPAAGGFAVEVDDERSGPEHRALALAADDGRWRATLLVERAGGRPAALLEPGPGGVAVTRWGDWREAHGLWLPHRVETDDPDGRSRVRTVESVAPLPAYFASRFAAPGRPADAIFEADRGATLEARRTASGHLLLHPRLDGRDVGWFLLDSGAGACFLDAALAAELGWEARGAVSVAGGAGSTRGTRLAGGELALGPLRVAGLPWVARDLRALSATLGTPLAGVLGYDLLARAVLVVDGPAGTVELHDPARWTPPEGSVALVLDGRVPCVEAELPGGRVWLGIDTGSDDTLVLNAPLVRRLGLVGDREELLPVALEAHGGRVQALRAELGPLSVAGRRQERVRATLVESAAGAYAADSPDGYLGLGVLARYRLVLDLPHECVGLVDP